MGAVDAVLVDCLDRSDEMDEDRFLVFRLPIGRSLLPRVLEALLSSSAPRVFDLRLDIDCFVLLEVDRSTLLSGTSSRIPLLSVSFERRLVADP